ncbi:MAG: hypothetical protein H6745_04570 [Deltaproteobacteria bacterium]|nr:hypothetical protein [Deltaproteobacteria bacterium]
MRQPAILRLAPFGAAALLALGACADDGGTESFPAADLTGAFVVTSPPPASDYVTVLDLMMRDENEQNVAWARVAREGGQTRLARFPCRGGAEYDFQITPVGIYDAAPERLGGLYRVAPEGALSGVAVSTFGVTSATCVAGVETSVDLGVSDVYPYEPAKQGFFDLAVAPVFGVSVRDALWDVEVLTLGGDRVFMSRVASSVYGDGSGVVSYLGTCSAADGDTPNTIRWTLLGVYADALGPGAEGDVGDGVPASSYRVWGPLELTRPAECVDLQDVFLTFPVVVALRDDDGVHDDLVRVGEETVCDVAFSCGGEAPALEVACVAPEAPTILMDDLVVRCDDGGDDVIIDPEVAGTIAETAVDGGVESRWTVPVAVDAARLAAGACRVATRTTPLVAATDTTAGLVDGAIPAGLAYPMVAVDAALGGGASACEPARPEDGATASLRVVYSRADAATDTVFARASR